MRREISTWQMTDSLIKQLQLENEELRKANEQLQQELQQQRKLADQLKESEEIFATFLEHNPAYVFFKDEQLRSLRLSKNYEQMLGRPLEEILGKSMDELFPPEMARQMIELDSKILRDGVPYSVEEELNGRYYSTVKFPIVIEGKPARLAGFTKIGRASCRERVSVVV